MLEMRRTLLNLYLTKVAAGDSSFESKLAAQLTDRLLYLPLSSTKKSSDKKSSSGCTIDVLQVKEDDGAYIPVFVAKKKLESWCAEKGYSTKSISLFGGDLAMVMPEGVSLLINPGSDLAVKLPAAVLKAMRVDAEEEEGLDLKEVIHQPVAAAPVELVRHVVPQTVVIQPAAQAEEKTPPAGWYNPVEVSVSEFTASGDNDDPVEEDDQAILEINHRR